MLYNTWINDIALLGKDVRIKLDVTLQALIVFSKDDVTACLDFYDRIECYDMLCVYDVTDTGEHVIKCTTKALITVLAEMLDVINGGYVNEK